MKQFKTCKGQNKAYGFSSCGNQVPAKSRTYGLCRKCFREWCKSTPEGLEYIQKNVIPRAKKEVKKKEKARKKAEKERFTDYKSKLQDKVNEIVRLIDIGLPCLARNYHPNQIHAGHIFSRGSEKYMRFNLHNIHRQSAQSNHFQNEDGLLREGLVNEYGQNYFDFISELRQTPPLKYSNLEYKDFYKKACKIANDLKREGRVFTKDQRIYMRNQVNIELEIYDPQYCTYQLKTQLS